MKLLPMFMGQNKILMLHKETLDLIELELEKYI